MEWNLYLYFYFFGKIYIERFIYLLLFEFINEVEIEIFSEVILDVGI